jgi:hypothetical protein
MLSVIALTAVLPIIDPVAVAVAIVGALPLGFAASSTSVGNSSVLKEYEISPIGR